MVSAAGWWNPVTWLQNVAGFFHGAYDAGGAVLNVLGSALTILTQFFRFFFDTGHFIADAVNWLTSALFPPELQTWFLGTIGAPGQQWNSAQIYESLYQGMMAPALTIAGVGAASRIIRALVDHRTGSMETILSVLPRFLLAVAVIGVPGTPVSLGYTAIVWCIDASIAVSGAVVGLILHASLLNGFQPGQGWFTHLYGVLTASSNEMVAVAVGGIPLLILLLYAGFLMIVRTVMLGFVVVAAPLCLATAVFDTNNRFFHWWLDLFGSVLLTPLVLGMAIALSFTLASHVVAAFAVGPLLAVVILCGGLWFAGKMVHQLTWRGFSHGSALAGFAAGAATMVAPVHRLSSAGFMAEALGANRDGGNSAVNFMKRLRTRVPRPHPNRLESGRTCRGTICVAERWRRPRRNWWSPERGCGSRIRWKDRGRWIRRSVFAAGLQRVCSGSCQVDRCLHSRPAVWLCVGRRSGQNRVEPDIATKSGRLRQ